METFLNAICMDYVLFRCVENASAAGEIPAKWKNMMLIVSGSAMDGTLAIWEVCCSALEIDLDFFRI